MAAEQIFQAEILKVNNRKLTASMFRQLYQEKPFNNEYELLFELKGKVFQPHRAQIFQSAEYIIFAMSQGLRKFDFSKMTSRNAAKLSTCIYDALYFNATSKLAELTEEIKNYYNAELANVTGERYSRLLRLVYGNASSDEQKSDENFLMGFLSPSFEQVLLNEHQKYVEKTERWNQLIVDFKNAPQIFI